MRIERLVGVFEMKTKILMVLVPKHKICIKLNEELKKKLMSGIMCLNEDLNIVTN
jgi:hypothetical protein